jgi:hypothetical protein
MSRKIKKAIYFFNSSPFPHFCIVRVCRPHNHFHRHSSLSQPTTTTMWKKRGESPSPFAYPSPSIHPHLVSGFCVNLRFFVATF